MSDWEVVYFCPETDKKIDYINYTGGVCPSCGHRQASSWCHGYERSRRWIAGKDYRWWNPMTWKLGEWQYRIEVPEATKEWCEQ